MKQNELYDTIKKLNSIHDYGCYFLDLLFVVKRREPEMSEILDYYDVFIQNDWMEEDCYIKNPCAILEYFTGKKFKIKKDSVFDKQATYIIGYYYNPVTNLNHFVVINRFNEVLWDSIENSKTVRDGFITSYRLFYECK